MSAWIALGFLVIAGLVLVLRHDAGTVAGFSTGDFAGIVAMVALLIFLGGAMMRDYRNKFARAVRDGVMWALVAFALVAVYTYRDEVLSVGQRIAGELVPGMPVALETQENGRAVVRVRKQAAGQFVARASVNGETVSMIVDTGASSIVLTQADARRAGVDMESLSYTVPVLTANGTAQAARVRLGRVSVGTVGLDNVEALIAEQDALHKSLLGMSFLSRLRSYEFSGDFLTLRS